MVAPVLIDAFGLDAALIVDGRVASRPRASFSRVRSPPSTPPPHRPTTGDSASLPRLRSSPRFPECRSSTLLLGSCRSDVRPAPSSSSEGDAGDRFYIVVEGELDVVDSAGTAVSARAGGSFGEIALMRDVPRTATVTARTDVVLYALDREDFLAAVTGHPQSAEAAETVVSARLSGPAATGYRSTAT